MRISTAEFFRLSTQTIQRAQTALSEQQLQIASGQKLVRPSDDPLASAQLLELDSATRATEQFSRNAGRAQSRLALTEQTLADVTGNLQRVRELTVTAANATQTNETRSAIASELRERLSELVAQANTQDADGEYVFAGNVTQSKPFLLAADGAVSYQGDDGQRFVSIEQSRQVALNESGNRVFMGVPEGNGTFVLEADTANTGSGFLGAGSLRDVADFVPLDYVLVYDSDASAPDVDGDGEPDSVPGFRIFVGDPVDTGGVDGSGNPVFSNQLALDADGNAQFNPDGSPVLLSGAGTPAAQIPFSAEDGTQTLENIPGIAFELGGTPADGDTFTVTPAGSESLFATYAELIDNLETPANSPREDAQFRSRINASLANLSKALDHVIERRAEAGGRQRVVETQIEINADRELQLKSTRSNIADLDYAEAISQLQQNLLGLQAAQQSFLRIQNLSLFNLL